MAPRQSFKGGKGKAISSRSNQSSSKAVVVHCRCQSFKGGKGKAISSRSNQSSSKAVVVHGSSNWSGQSQTQKGKTSSSWVHQDSKTQLSVSKKGSQIVFKQQFVEKKTDISKEKFQGFTKEVKEQISAKKTVTYKMDTAAPKLLGPKTNNKKVEIMDHNPNPVNQKVVTMGFSFSFPM